LTLNVCFGRALAFAFGFTREATAPFLPDVFLACACSFAIVFVMAEFLRLFGLVTRMPAMPMLG
jgi:hypothetical protein